MKRNSMLAILAVLVLMLAGCANTVQQGYFYVAAQSDGYVVMSDTVDGISRVISAPTDLKGAAALCDQLNKDLASHVNGTR